jgi:hypothetical protein
MAISLKHQFVYIHCQKTGGTSIKQWLQRSLQEPLMDWEHFGIGDVRKMIHKEVFNKLFKFSIVRNPWDRVVSDYFFCRLPMFENVDPERYKLFQSLNFKEYVQRELFPYPQSKFLCDNERLLMDFVGKYETLILDMQYIARRLHIEPPSEFPHKNQTSHEHYSHYYDEETREIVDNYHQEDIKRFKYEFQSP